MLYALVLKHLFKKNNEELCNISRPIRARRLVQRKVKMFGLITLFGLVTIMYEPAAGVLPRPESRLRSENRSKRMVGGDEITAYDLPYMCSLHYTQDYFPIGTCSIITSKVVLTSMETIDVENTEAVDILAPSRVIEPGYNPASGLHFTKAKFSLQNTNQMTVSAGKDHLRPTQEIKLLKNYQESRIQNYYIVDTGVSIDWDIEDPHWPFAPNINNNTQQDFEWFTFKFNFMFLSLQSSFTWSTHVLPIPMDRDYSNDYKKLKKDIDDYQELMNTQDINEFASVLAPGQYCAVGGWALRGDQPMTFKEVMMVTRVFCQTVYCSYQPICCLEYPSEQDICFTSTTYGDICDFDQGSALYCAFFKNSVVGFVKKSVNCGLQSTPAVYTPAWMILKAYFGLFSKESWDTRPLWNAYKIYPSSTVPTV